jgi:potassium uptake TrkH family protein
LPAASTKPITFTQALFTSTSAVTVTGLAVLDTGKDFTIFGQVIILILIQLGGLGVLTITNIFALIFKSSTTYRNRMMVSDMIKEFNSNNTFSTLFKIVLITLIVEFIGALLIFFSISGTKEVHNPLFFSMFHAISAFCNAGFSPMSNSIYEDSVKFNYSFQLIICWLVITGGLGYLIMISHYKKLKNWILSEWSALRLTSYTYEKVLIKTSANARLVLTTTFLLLIIGTLGFFYIEYDGVLKEHSMWGKIVVSIFNSVTPRTAGFNNVNMTQLQLPTLMLIMVLMWIGASPASTGGGIKTTTFAIAIMNLINQIKGRDRIIYNYKEITSSSINQVSAVIFLSIFAIGGGTFFLAHLNPDKVFRDLMFETMSAYSTVGLSLNLTSSLSENSLYVLIIVMFLGRVSFLTFLIGIWGLFPTNKPSGPEPFYPKDNVFIN